MKKVIVPVRLAKAFSKENAQMGDCLRGKQLGKQLSKQLKNSLLASN